MQQKQKCRNVRALAAAVAEALEPRRLLAGIESGVLVARGTEAADVISLRRTGPDDVIVTTNGNEQTFDMDNFSGVRLEGLGGDDRFQMIDPLVSPVVRNTTVMGGAGWDAVDYSTRTEDLRFSGFAQPDTRTPFHFLRVTSGLQEDRIDSNVEHFAGGSGDDDFWLHGQLLEDDAPRAVSMEGFGGDDHFSHPADLTATMYGGAGNDLFEEDDWESRFTAIYAGDGNDVIDFNNEGRADFLDAGPGTDTISLWGSHREVIDLRPYLGLENVEGAGNTTVIGNELDNRILASNGDGPVTLIGNGGNDTLVGSEEADQLDGGEGDDSLAS
ncbi:MAG TPA: hypothetical protein VGR35_17025, partial [Tepidisphaeraceae bacterium]|nr:hypothetical protein [Tepidisphaeraceae bacterium]